MFYSTKEFQKYNLVKVLHKVLKVSVRQHPTPTPPPPKMSFSGLLCLGEISSSLQDHHFLYNCILFGRQEKKKKKKTSVQQEKHFWGEV